MAKKRINAADIKEAQNELIKLFVDSLKLKSKGEYKQVVNALNTEEIYGPNKGRLFLELLVRMIPSNKDGVKVKNQKWSEVEKIVEAMDKHLEKFKNKTSPEYKKSYKSYLNRFFKFLRDNQNHNNLSISRKGLKMNAAATAVKNAFIQGFDGEIYLYSALRTKFKSRLRCQDRTSGDKIWLPLRFIAKLYNIDKKKKQKKINPFSQWLDSLVDGICVHYTEINNTQKVCHLTFNKNLSLVFKNKDKEGYDVFVWQINNGRNEEFRVLTPTGKGNQKVPMKVKSISEIDIDHVKSIDSTLKEKEQYLTELKKVSDFYKDMVEEEEYDENAKAEELYKKLNLPFLQKELITIGNDGLLRLMDSKYNSQKSNGETFKEIRKIADDKYIGIIEEGIKMDNYPKGNSMTLYQELTDVLSQTGNLSIAYSNSTSLNGQDVNQDPNFTLKDIIDKI